MTEEIIKCVKGESCIHCGSTYCRFVDEVDELKQENKELKKMYRLSCLKCEYKNTKADVDKYRSALEEIREKIKSLNKDICNNCGWYNTDNCQPNGYVCHDLIEIKNKINEALNKG